jgi:hypothetical protein
MYKLTPGPSKPGFNYKRANWQGFSDELLHLRHDDDMDRFTKKYYEQNSLIYNKTYFTLGKETLLFSDLSQIAKQHFHLHTLKLNIHRASPTHQILINTS